MSAGEPFSVLGVRVDPLSHAGTIERIRNYLETPGDKKALTLTAASMNNLAVADRNPAYRDALNSLDLVLPDGAPLYWLARLHGTALSGRTYGPDLMRMAIFKGPESFRHFILGGSEQALALCREKIEAERPGSVHGMFSPPFGDWTEDQEADIAHRISMSGANIVWVCLGAPRQDFWIIARASRFPGVVFAAVGAAVDFIGGTKPQAPRWMQKAGLEWLFRLLSEPRRLWRRYLVDMPPAVLKLLVQLARRTSS